MLKTTHDLPIQYPLYGQLIHLLISGMHHYQCVVPKVVITPERREDDSEPCRLLHSGRGSMIPGPAGESSST